MKLKEQINEYVWNQASGIIHREIKDPTERQIENKYKELMKERQSKGQHIKDWSNFARFLESKIQESIYQDFKDSKINKKY